MRWPWSKRGPDEVAKVAEKAIESIRREAMDSVRAVGQAHSNMVHNLDVKLEDVVKRFQKQIDEILGAYKIRSLDQDVRVLGEDVVTDDFPDLDSRAVFANPYAIPDPDFSEHLKWIDPSTPDDDEN